MAKNLLRDILPKKKIRESPAEDRPNSRRRAASDVIYHRAPVEEINYGRQGSKWRIWAVAFAAIVVLVFAVSAFLSSASVKISKRVDSSILDLQLNAKKQPSAGELSFSFAPFSKDGGMSVQADGQKKVERKASAKIIIYNNFSASPQRLVKNTRFQTAKGLIFRTDRSVVIPGRRTEGGGVVPGSLEALVYADSPGPDYNIGMTDFTVPGFKSDKARYAGFYARSKTPMTGGFTGMAKYLSDDKLKAASDSLKVSLEKQAIAELRSSIPKGYFIPDGLYVSNFQPLQSDDTSGDTVTVKGRVSINAFLFNTEEFSNYIAKIALKETELGTTSVQVSNLGALIFKIQNSPGSLSADTTELKFSLKGSANFVWLYNADGLRADLAGKPKSAVASILKNYRSISRIDISVSPFWASHLPSNVAKIKIEDAAN
jgi:hypothetical protein